MYFSSIYIYISAISFKSMEQMQNKCTYSIKKFDLFYETLIYKVSSLIYFRDLISVNG